WLTPMAAIRSTTPFRPCPRACSQRQGDDRVLVLPRAHLAFREDPALGDPPERVFEHFFGVRFEDDSLTGSPPAGVHDVVAALAELVLLVVPVPLPAHPHLSLVPPHPPPIL